MHFNDKFSRVSPILGLGLADAVPDANTIWTEALKKAGAIDGLFRRFHEALRVSGFLAMSGQIVDATIIAAPKQRNTIEEKAAIREGRIPEDWKDKPAKLAQKDRDARWTVKYTKAKVRDDASTPPVELAIPTFGYKNHISIDRAFGLIREWTATNAAAQRRAAGGCSGSRQHGQRRMGRHRVSIRKKRGDVVAPPARVADTGQSRLHHAPPRLATREIRRCVRLGGRRTLREAEPLAEIDLDIPKAREQIDDQHDCARPSAENPVIEGVQLCNPA